MKDAIYKRVCERAWDGDGFGAEWRCGVSVRANIDGLPDSFTVSEDDGNGNGNVLANIAGLDNAKRYADAYVKWLDFGRGYANTPEFAEVCHIAETCSAPEAQP